MPFVLDVSITACWAFDDEDHRNAASALERLANDHAVVPGLWWYEIRNILLMNERQGRISSRGIAKFYLELARRGSMSLATLDTDLAQAAKDEKISLVGEDE